MSDFFIQPQKTVLAVPDPEKVTKRRLSALSPTKILVIGFLRSLRSAPPTVAQHESSHS